MKTVRDRYGLLAEFDSPDRLLAAAQAARERGYTHVEAYAPFPVDGLAESLGATPRRIAPLMLLGGIIGAVAIYAIQYYSAVVDYPINVGGRPFDSWPAFVPPALEMAVLGAALAGAIGTLLRDGLPRFHHPLFGIARFERASCDRFFLCIRASDPHFKAEATRRFLQDLAPEELAEVAIS